ncbi:AzlD domain-containing protein [Paenibacillus taichungensis]|uniref:AzlD domain-containing protein n=1 Tax=Paenibacillus taichungensis TaxID=484184 RepID=UPI0035E28D04
MEVRWTILLIILGTAIVTFIPRVLPLMVLSRMQLSQGVIQWLKHVPVTVMAALIAQELFLSDGKFSIISNKLELIVSLPTLTIAILTRSLLGTVLVGLISMMVLRFLFSS